MQRRNSGKDDGQNDSHHFLFKAILTIVGLVLWVYVVIEGMTGIIWLYCTATGEVMPTGGDFIRQALSIWPWGTSVAKAVLSLWPGGSVISKAIFPVQPRPSTFLLGMFTTVLTVFIRLALPTWDKHPDERPSYVRTALRATVNATVTLLVSLIIGMLSDLMNGFFTDMIGIPVLGGVVEACIAVFLIGIVVFAVRGSLRKPVDGRSSPIATQDFAFKLLIALGQWAVLTFAWIAILIDPYVGAFVLILCVAAHQVLSSVKATLA